MKKNKKNLVVGLDFDGSCLTHSYPNMGKDIGAIPVLKRLVENGHQLMLWTMRSHKLTISGRDTLDEAVKWFADNEIPLWGINENPLQTQTEWSTSHKQHADIFIDDAALGCPLKYDMELSNRAFIDWDKVEAILENEKII